jgi:hypothetical protein
VQVVVIKESAAHCNAVCNLRPLHKRERKKENYSEQQIPYSQQPVRLKHAVSIKKNDE